MRGTFPLKKIYIYVSYNMYYSLLQLSEFQEANINFMSLNTQFCFYPSLFILDLCFI